jgi:hypothetical protein
VPAEAAKLAARRRVPEDEVVVEVLGPLASARKVVPLRGEDALAVREPGERVDLGGDPGVVRAEDLDQLGVGARQDPEQRAGNGIGLDGGDSAFAVGAGAGTSGCR